MLLSHKKSITRGLKAYTSRCRNHGVARNNRVVYFLLSATYIKHRTKKYNGLPYYIGRP